jgi:hypothetical protein
MGNEWEIEAFKYDSGEGWVTFVSFEGTPEEALGRLINVRRDRKDIKAFRLTWRGNE